MKHIYCVSKKSKSWHYFFHFVFAESRAPVALPCEVLSFVSLIGRTMNFRSPFWLVGYAFRTNFMLFPCAGVCVPFGESKNGFLILEEISSSFEQIQLRIFDLPNPLYRNFGSPSRLKSGNPPTLRFSRGNWKLTFLTLLIIINFLCRFLPNFLSSF